MGGVLSLIVNTFLLPVKIFRALLMFFQFIWLFVLVGIIVLVFIYKDDIKESYNNVKDTIDNIKKVVEDINNKVDSVAS